MHPRGQPLAGDRELHVARARHGAVGVQQPGQQRSPLRLGGAQVGGRHVLVAEHPQRPQQPLQRAVVGTAGLAALQAAGRTAAVGAGRRRGATGEAAAAASAALAAGADLRGGGQERPTADQARAVDRRGGCGQSQAVQVATGLGDHLDALALEVHDELVVRGGQPRTGGVAVAQPRAEDVRGQRQRGLRQLQRRGGADGVVGAALCRRAAQRLRQLDRRAHGRRPGRGPARCAGVRQPLVLRIGDQDGAVGELDLVAGAALEHGGGRDDPHGAAVGAEELVARLHLAHRRPARRRRQRRVERERLAEPRPARDDDELAGVQAVGEGVEVGEAGGDAGHRAGAAADGLHLVHRRLHDVAEDGVVLARAPLGDVVDRLLGPVDEVVDLAAVAGVPELHDAGAGLDEAPQHGALGDDPGVVAGVGRRGDAGQQRVQVGRAADAGEVAGPRQLARDGDRVGRLAAAVQVQDDVVDRLVGRPVEVAGPDHLDDVGDRVLAQEHAAEHGHLRRDVLRRGALELR